MNKPDLDYFNNIKRGSARGIVPLETNEQNINRHSQRDRDRSDREQASAGVTRRRGALCSSSSAAILESSVQATFRLVATTFEPSGATIFKG